MGLVRLCAVFSALGVLATAIVAALAYWTYYWVSWWRVLGLLALLAAWGVVVAWLVFHEVLFVLVSLAVVAMEWVVLPLLRAVRSVRVVDDALQALVSAVFGASFYVLVRVDTGLQHVLGLWGHRHLPTAKPLSLVNSMDPSFEGFDLAALSPHVPESKRVFHARALAMAVASKISYEVADVVCFEARAWGFRECIPIGDHHSSARGFIAHNHEVVVVSFAGTNPLNLQHLVTDLAGLPINTNSPLGRVHGGFAKALGVHEPDHNSVYSFVEAVVVREIAQGKKLFVTGHSLGGALAQLFASQFALKQPSHAAHILGVFTFGAPRLGDQTHAEHVRCALGNRFHRFVNNLDFVPRIPCKLPFLRSSSLLLDSLPGGDDHVWTPAGTHYVFDSRGRLSVVDSPRLTLDLGLVLTHCVGILSPRTVRRVWEESTLRLVFRLVFPFFVNEHFMCDYVGLVREQLQLADAKADD